MNTNTQSPIPTMIGAIVGDIADSLYEFHNIKTRDFTLFADYLGRRARPTDDTVMTLAVMQSLLDAADNLPALPAAAVRRMQEFGRRYPYAGYGGSFRRWIASEKPAIRNAISIGGDSDTIAAISGAVAGARWRVPDNFRAEAPARLDEFQRGTIVGFEKRFS